MAADPTDADLREAARHRGFRLIKSRVKTPGKGDYGKVGLVDAKGVPVFGQGDKGLTASPREVADFLRKGETATWAASVETIPAMAPRAPRAKPNDDMRETASVLRPRKAARHRPAEDIEDAPRARQKTVLRKSEASPDPKPRPAPEPKAAPVLKLRKATRDDAAAVAALVALVPGDTTGANIAGQLPARHGNAVLVADRGGVIGVVAWTMIPTLHRGLIGRITLIVVAERSRRSGVGRALLDAAIMAMTKAGAQLIEAISDIEIRNSHRFFHDLGFEQTSYRFARQSGSG